MKKNLKRIINIAIIFVLLISTVCLASGGESAASKISGIGNKILSAVLWVGYAISLGMVVFIGIKYVLGSADAKANMKSAIVSWLIGAFLVFACTSIVGFVVSSSGLNDDSGLVGEIIDAAN